MTNALFRNKFSARLQSALHRRRVQRLQFCFYDRICKRSSWREIGTDLVFIYYCRRMLVNSAFMTQCSAISMQESINVTTKQ